MVLFGISLIYVSFFRINNITGKTILEHYTNETSCVVAGYTWEVLTEKNCTTITTCVNETISCNPCLEYEIINETTNETGECINWTSCVNESCGEEQDCINVTVGGQCVGEVCDSEHLDLCFEENDCDSAGGYWYYNSCHLDEKKISSNETEENIDEFANDTEKVENITNIVENVEVMPILTNDEREVLVNHFGNESVKIIKAEQFEDGIEITFKLNDYSMIRFYDKEFSDVELNLQIEKDRINLLKDIANTFLQEDDSPKQIEDFIGEYPI